MHRSWQPLQDVEMGSASGMLRAILPGLSISRQADQSSSPHQIVQDLDFNLTSEAVSTSHFCSCNGAPAEALIGHCKADLPLNAQKMVHQQNVE